MSKANKRGISELWIENVGLLVGWFEGCEEGCRLGCPVGSAESTSDFVNTKRNPNKSLIVINKVIIL